MILCFVFSSRRRHTRCALVTGVQTCALPILLDIDDARTRIEADREAAQARLTRYIAENEPVAQGAAPLADVDLIELRRTLESNPGIILADTRSEEHTSELQSLMRISYAVFCLKKTNRVQTEVIQTYIQ